MRNYQQRLLTLFLRNVILLFRLPREHQWILKRGLSVSWRKTTASLILYPRCPQAVPRICSDPATHRQSREIMRSQPILPSTVKFRLPESVSSHRKIERPCRTDRPREMAQPLVDLLIRVSDSEGPPPIRFLRSLLPMPLPLTSQSGQDRQRAPSHHKEHRKSLRRQTKFEVRAEGSLNLACPLIPILHMAVYRIRHHTVDLSDIHVSTSSHQPPALAS